MHNTFHINNVLFPSTVVLITLLTSCGGGDDVTGSKTTTARVIAVADTEDTTQNRQNSHSKLDDSAPDNSKDNNSTTTVAGALRVITTENESKKLILNSVDILKDDYPVLDIEHLYKFTTADVALIHADLGGKMTAVYYLVVLLKNKQYQIVDVTRSDGGEVDVEVGHDSLTLYLGFDGKNYRVATYKNGQVNISSENVQKKEAADDQDCEWLYNDIYLAFIQNGSDCEGEPKDVGAMATERQYDALSLDPRLDLHALESIASQSCKSKTKIAYSEFQKEVCIAH